MSAAIAAAHRNRRTLLLVGALPLAMLGLGYASVPLYRVFCQVTGFNGTPGRATEADLPSRPVPGRFVTVRFDSNTSPRLPWRFEPERTTMRVAVGARELTYFEATNRSDRRVTGTATFNVTPGQAGQYFTKIECFCFTRQTLEPGETARLPVVFFVQPDFAKDSNTADISEITLSYTFYPVDSGGTPG